MLHLFAALCVFFFYFIAQVFFGTDTQTCAMPRNATTAAALATLASSLDHQCNVRDVVGRCDSAPSLFHACSRSGSAIAVVHRHTVLPVQLSATAESRATYTFDPGADFIGKIYLVVHVPVLINQCAALTDAAGRALQPRYIVSADADRPGSFLGPRLEGVVVKEGAPQCTLHADSGAAGALLDQNAACDYAAYFTEYAAARLVAGARLVADGVTEVSALTCDVLAAVNELFRSFHSPTARGLGRARTHIGGEDAATCADLKARSLQTQCWTVPLPFFSHGEAFPNALLRRRLRQRHRPTSEDAGEGEDDRDAERDGNEDEDGERDSTLMVTSLQLELTFNPMYQLVCNGSNTLPSNVSITENSGHTPVRTITFPDTPHSDTSAFAYHATAAAAAASTNSAFDPQHFRVELLVEEFIVDPECLEDLFYANDRHVFACSRFRPLPPVTIEAGTPELTASIDLSHIRGGLEALVWFPQLQMDSYRHMWYRMRGMVDQVAGHATRALVAHSVTVGNHARHVPVHTHAPWGRFTDKEIYVCDLVAAGGSTGGFRVHADAYYGCAEHDALMCRANANVFANNAATDGFDMRAGQCGGPPTVTVLAFAVERQLLAFQDQQLVNIM